MPRIRSVKPEFFDDYDFIRSLSRDERLFYIGLWVRCCDDRGVFPLSTPWIRKEVFPYDDDVTVATVAGWIESLTAKGRLVHYSMGGKEYCLIVKFLEHQHIDRPSKKFCYPIPPDWPFDEVAWKWGDLPANAASPRRALDEPSTSPRSARASEVEVEMEVEKEMDIPSPSGTRQPAKAGDAPPSLTPQTVIDLWNEICGDILPKVMSLTDERRRQIRARMARPGRDEAWWRSYFNRIRGAPHCRGDNDRGWRATFDFAIRSETVVAKVLEGNYDHGSGGIRGGPTVRGAPQDRASYDV